MLCFVAYDGTSFMEYLQKAWHYVWNTLTMRVKYSIDGVSFPTNTVEKTSASINGSIWSIPKEVTLYMVLLATLFIYVTLGKSKHLLTLICLTFILSPAFFNLYGSTSISQKWLISLFFTGSLFATYKDKIIVNWMLPLGLVFLYRTFNKSYLIMELIEVMAIITFAMWLASTKIIRKVKLRHDISYGVYIYGWPVQQFLLFFCPQINPWDHMVLSVLISFGIGYLSAIFIEEPAIRLAQNINKKIGSNSSNPL